MADFNVTAAAALLANLDDLQFGKTEFSHSAPEGGGPGEAFMSRKIGKERVFASGDLTAAMAAGGGSVAILRTQLTALFNGLITLNGGKDGEGRTVTAA